MATKDDDKRVEHDRFDARARRELESFSTDKMAILGSQQFPEYLREPYYFFESVLKNKLKGDHRILEIGAGSGLHTVVLVESGARVVATDISPNSLKLLEYRFMRHKNIYVETKVADMENLPFEDESFDFIVCAGSLSYGDNDVVIENIYKKLKFNGCFICVDSLNNNYIYRLNRFIHFFFKRRSYSTLQNMPSLKLIEKYRERFAKTDVEFFGSLCWIVPILRFFMRDESIALFLNKFDRFIEVKASAFKFVMICRK